MPKDDTVRRRTRPTWPARCDDSTRSATYKDDDSVW